MAKISALPVVSDALAGDLLPITRGGNASKAITVETLSAAIRLLLQQLVSDANQAKTDTKSLLDNASAVLSMLSPGPNGAGLRLTDKRGNTGALIDALGLTLAGRLTAGEIAGNLLVAQNVSTGGASIGPIALAPGEDGIRVIDRRGNIGLDWRPSTGVLRTTANPTGGAGGSATAATGPRVRIVSQQGMTPYKAGALTSNGTTQVSGTDTLPFKVATRCRRLQLAFFNGYLSNVGPLLTPNSWAGDFGTGLPLRMTAVVQGDGQSKVTLTSPAATPVSSGSFMGYVSAGAGSAAAGSVLTITSAITGKVTPGALLIAAGVPLNTSLGEGSGTSFGLSRSFALGSAAAPIAFTTTGGPTYMISPGVIDISAPVSGLFSPGTIYYTRTYKEAAPGQAWGYSTGDTCWPYLQAGGSPKTTDVVNGSSVTDGSDITLKFQYQGAAMKGGGDAFGPAMFLGEPIDPSYAAISVLGDSGAAGAGDTNYGRGHLTRAVEAAGRVPFNGGIGGLGLLTVAKFTEWHQFVTRYSDHVLIHLGGNDIIGGGVSFATMKTALLTYFLGAIDGSCKVWLGTIWPRLAASTDSYATYAGQTRNQYDAVRITWNNWLRDTTATGMRAYLIAGGVPASRIGDVVDTCPVLERNADGSAIVLDANGQQNTASGGYYLVNGSANGYTNDGIHPNAALYAMLAQAPTLVAALAKMTV